MQVPGLTLDWTRPGAPPRLGTGPGLPVSEFLSGRTAEEAADLLPRLFNVCAVTQRVAARLALGLPALPGDDLALRDEILREHLLAFCVRLPDHLCLAPRPDLLQGTGPALRASLFGSGSLPDDLSRFLDALRTDPAPGLAVLHGLLQQFAPGEATSDPLPEAATGDPFDGAARENSAAGRRQGHPLLSGIAEIYGRGPLWRATARALEIEALTDGWQPAAQRHQDGTAEVMAARGTYFCRAETDAHRQVRSVQRATPTDHGTAPDGAMHQSLARLTNPTPARVALLMAVLDPCAPVTGTAAPEPAHA
jgi:hypothetical protein